MLTKPSQIFAWFLQPSSHFHGITLLQKRQFGSSSLYIWNQKFWCLCSHCSSVYVCTCYSIACLLATSGIKYFCFCLFFQSLLIVFLVWNEEFIHRLLVIFPGTIILLHLPNHHWLYFLISTTLRILYVHHILLNHVLATLHCHH